MTHRFRTTITEMITKIEELIKAGNSKRIIIKEQNGEKYLEVPILIGLLFTIAAPIITVIAAIAGFASKFTLEIITKNQPDDSSVFEVINNNE